MLLEFSLENYLSFKEEATLSLVGNKTTKEHETTNVISFKDTKVLKSSAIFGANASGKSNLLTGLAFMKKVVLNSFSEALLEFPTLARSRAFKFNPTTNEESSYFEVIFILNSIQYRYGFEINKGIIEAEWLYYVPNKIETVLFTRSFQTIKINASSYKEGNKLDVKTRENVLFLSVCSQFNGVISNDILNWFKNLNIISGLDDHHYREYTINKLKTDSNFRKWLNKFVGFLEISKITIEKESGNSSIDILLEEKELQDFTRKEKANQPRQNENRLKAWHNVFDDQKILVDTVGLDFYHESKGTQKLIYLLGPIYDSLKSGKILFIDELDARLHSILTKELIKIFHAGNHSNAQYVFVIQDPILLENECFRRDQIYFVEKDQYGASKLYSLLDYKKVRKDERYARNYLKGNYGAVPYVSDIYVLAEEIPKYGKEE